MNADYAEGVHKIMIDVNTGVENLRLCCPQ